MAEHLGDDLHGHAPAQWVRRDAPDADVNGDWVSRSGGGSDPDDTWAR